MTVDRFVEIGETMVAVGWVVTKFVFVALIGVCLAFVLYAVVRAVVIEVRKPKGGKRGERKV